MAQVDGTVLRDLSHEPLISGTDKDITARFRVGLDEPENEGSRRKLNGSSRCGGTDGGDWA